MTVSDKNINFLDTINELDLSPLFDLLELLNLPLIPASLTNKTTNYIEQMARVKRILGLDIFFGFQIMSDPRNNSRNVIYFNTPEHSSPFPRYFYFEFLNYYFQALIVCIISIFIY